MSAASRDNGWQGGTHKEKHGHSDRQVHFSHTTKASPVHLISPSLLSMPSEVLLTQLSIWTLENLACTSNSCFAGVCRFIPGQTAKEISPKHSRRCVSRAENAPGCHQLAWLHFNNVNVELLVQPTWGPTHTHWQCWVLLGSGPCWRVL